jgi:hypothetical protein
LGRGVPRSEIRKDAAPVKPSYTITRRDVG